MQALKNLAAVLQNPGAVTAYKAVGGLATAGFLVKYSYDECMFNIPAGHAAALYNRFSGIGEYVYDEGTHFKLPYFDRVISMDVKSRPYLTTSTSGSRDLQTVNIAVRVLTHPDKSKVPEIYRSLGLKYDEKVLPSIVNEVLKAVIARYNASQLITQRDAISRLIADQLSRRCSEFHLVLDDFSITHLAFSQEYTQAIENKKVAQQEAERAKYHVTKALEEKKSMIIKAQGDGRAVELIGSAISDNPAYIELKQLETAKDVAQIMSRSANRVMLDSSQLILNIFSENQNIASVAVKN